MHLTIVIKCSILQYIFCCHYMRVISFTEPLLGRRWWFKYSKYLCSSGNFERELIYGKHSTIHPSLLIQMPHVVYGVPGQTEPHIIEVSWLTHYIISRLIKNERFQFKWIIIQCSRFNHAGCIRCIAFYGNRKDHIR